MKDADSMATKGTPDPSSGETKSPGKQALSEALARLNNALDGLENSANRAVEARSVVLNADEQVQRMSEDRARLARDLDSAQARANTLKDVNSEVSRRLVGAMETVRSVLEKKA